VRRMTEGGIHNGFPAREPLLRAPQRQPRLSSEGWDRRVSLGRSDGEPRRLPLPFPDQPDRHRKISAAARHFPGPATT